MRAGRSAARRRATSPRPRRPTAGRSSGSPQPEPEHWRLFYARGITYERTKRWPQAEADLLHALELEPDQPFVLNYLGYSWVDKGLNLDRPRPCCNRAVELRPDDGFIVDSLGWAYFRLGEYDKAVTYLERAVELEPGDPVINDHLGDAYWRVGRAARGALPVAAGAHLRAGGRRRRRRSRTSCATRPARADGLRAAPHLSPARRPMPPVEEPAPAKVNLDLLLTGRRADGYHELDSLVVFADLGDRLTFEPADRLHAGAARARSPRRCAGRAGQSRPARGAPARRRTPGARRSARIRLDKRLPVAAGLGGGSADAAAALRGLRRLWRLGLDAADLRRARASSSAPTCRSASPAGRRGCAASASGSSRCEPAGAADLLLVNPRQPLRDRRGVRGARALPDPPRTRSAAARRPRGSAGVAARAPQRSGGAGAPPAAGDRRGARGARRRSRAAALARMSGSGATCFGLFDDAPAAARAARGACAGRDPDWWVASTATRVGMIVLCTDFGLEGPYTGQVKAVLARTAPAVPVIDLFADLPAFGPQLAAYLLAAYGEGFVRRAT